MNQQQTKEKKDYTGLLIGLAFLAIGGFVFYTFYDLEQNGGRMTIPRPLIFLYDMGGKWLASGVFFLFGIIILFAFGNPNKKME